MPFGTPNILIRFIEIFIKNFFFFSLPFPSSPLFCFHAFQFWPFEAQIWLHFKHFLPFLFMIIHGWFINLSFLHFYHFISTLLLPVLLQCNATSAAQFHFLWGKTALCFMTAKQSNLNCFLHPLNFSMRMKTTNRQGNCNKIIFSIKIRR